MNPLGLFTLIILMSPGSVMAEPTSLTINIPSVTLDKQPSQGAFSLAGFRDLIEQNTRIVLSDLLNCKSVSHLVENLSTILGARWRENDSYVFQGSMTRNADCPSPYRVVGSIKFGAFVFVLE